MPEPTETPNNIPETPAVDPPLTPPTEPSSPTETSPKSSLETPVQAVPPATPNVSAPTHRKKKLTLLALLLAGLLVLLGGSAAAYYGVIVPNKPENVLKKSVQKLLAQHQLSSKGSAVVDMNGKDATIKNITVNFTGALDSDKHAFDVNLDAAASGVKLPVELRAVDQNLYFKLGDLSTLKGLAALGSPEIASVVNSVGDKLSNQWVEVDQSLLKQADAGCTTAFNGFSQQDVDQLGKLYDKNEFVIVKSKTADKVDGQAATKYELSFNQQKAQAFANQLSSVQSLKQLNDCAKTTQKATGDTETKPSNNPQPTVSVFVWIDGGKNMRQIQVKVADKDNVATLTNTFTNDKVNITKPDGAKPLLQVLGDFSSLFGGGGLPTSTNSPAASGHGTGLEGVSQACLQAIQKAAAAGNTTAVPPECM